MTLIDRGPRHNGEPSPPPLMDHQPPVLEEGQQNETVVALLLALGKTEAKLRHHGDLLWQRTVDWHRTPRVPPPDLADDGAEVDPATTVQLEDREGEAMANRYRGELAAIANRLRSDLSRLNQIDTNVIRSQPRRLDTKELMASQVAAAGLCVSCFRWDKTNKDREKDKTGTFYDKEACRRCAGFKHDHGIYPPIQLLEAWHARGKNWTSTMIAEALKSRQVPA